MFLLGVALIRMLMLEVLACTRIKVLAEASVWKYNSGLQGSDLDL